MLLIWLRNCVTLHFYSLIGNSLLSACALKLFENFISVYSAVVCHLSTPDGLGKNWRQLLADISKKAFCVYGMLFVSSFFSPFFVRKDCSAIPTRTELLSGCYPAHVKRSNFSQFVRFRLKLLSFSLPYRKLRSSCSPPGEGDTPYNGPYEEAPHERVTFFRLQDMKG